jgi:hypothetical protein
MQNRDGKEIFMSIFDRMKHGVDKTKFKADQLLRINTAQGELGAIRQNVARVNQQIALKVYELHKKGIALPQELIDLCIAEDNLNLQITQKEAQIEAIRNEEGPQYIPTVQGTYALNPCPACGFDVPPEGVFCSNCGFSMPEKKSVVPDSAMPQDQTGIVFCPNCGKPQQTGAAFCPDCGHKIA